MTHYLNYDLFAEYIMSNETRNYMTGVGPNSARVVDTHDSIHMEEPSLRGDTYYNKACELLTIGVIAFIAFTVFTAIIRRNRPRSFRRDRGF